LLSVPGKAALAGLFESGLLCSGVGRGWPLWAAPTAAEQQVIFDVLHSDRFADVAPAEVWAILLDEGVYLGSQSTFYRLLRQAGEVRERRAQATHPAKVKPEPVTISV